MKQQSSSISELSFQQTKYLCRGKRLNEKPRLRIMPSNTNKRTKLMMDDQHNEPQQHPRQRVIAGASSTATTTTKTAADAPLDRSSSSSAGTASSIFDNLVAWIRSSSSCMKNHEQDQDPNNERQQRKGASAAAFVHEDIQYNIDTRELYVQNGVIIRKGEIVFCIPNDRILDSEASLRRKRRMSQEENDDKDDESLRPPQQLLFSSSSCLVSDEQQQTQNKDMATSTTETANAKFYHPTSDVVLAWTLAQKPKEWQPYLDSLPSYDVIQAQLPRFWSDKLLQRRLRGATSVLDHIHEQQDGVQQDYDTMIALSKQRETHQHGGTTENNNKEAHCRRHCPTLEEFSYAMAIVTSRAFGNPRGNSALVPLLDLCNHVRGGGGGDKKNLSYTFERIEYNNDGGVQKPTNQNPDKKTEHDDKEQTSSSSDEYEVVVRASCDLVAPQVLCVTYGAQSNAQLLLNYGFCIMDNIEPDGSSNDFLQVGGTTLRMGPKSYTYGPFVQLLEQFYENPSTTAVSADNDIGPNTSDDDDMEAFLNECDEQEFACHDVIDDDEDDDDMGKNAQPVPTQDTNVEEERDAELRALDRLRERLMETADAYGQEGGDIAMAVINDCGSDDDDAITKYCAILIRSELRILRFYLMAIDLIQSKLKNDQQQSESSVSDVSPIDSRIREQVEDLVDAYFKIRHSDLLV